MTAWTVYAREVSQLNPGKTHFLRCSKVQIASIQHGGCTKDEAIPKGRELVLRLGVESPAIAHLRAPIEPFVISRLISIQPGLTIDLNRMRGLGR